MIKQVEVSGTTDANGCIAISARLITANEHIICVKSGQSYICNPFVDFGSGIYALQVIAPNGNVPVVNTAITAYCIVLS